MTYYDHATAMAFKLDRWGEEQKPRNYELEILASEQHAVASAHKKLTFFQRCLAAFKSSRAL